MIYEEILAIYYTHFECDFFDTNESTTHLIIDGRGQTWYGVTNLLPVALRQERAQSVHLKEEIRPVRHEFHAEQRFNHVILLLTYQRLEEKCHGRVELAAYLLVVVINHNVEGAVGQCLLWVCSRHCIPSK